MTKDSSAKRKAGKRKPEKLSFTQDFIPIKNLEHGIIETTDGRYIKILEIEPINFMLRSEEEQYEIICSFASWLKISPVHLQFKSITRKTDSDKHIAMLRKETETEESEQCKKLSEGYIRLIKDVGSREALTRRFFLIFRYEELRRNENSDYGQICSTLLTAEQNARAYFMQCGNNILQPKDPDEATAEILYMFFNRRSCVEEPFHSRVDRIVLDTMAAKNKVIGIAPIPHIRMAHFIAPRGIDLTHRNYIIMDGLYYSFLYIKGNGYPNKVRAGWMSSLINAGEGIDVDVFLRRENRSKTIDKVAQRIRLNCVADGTCLAAIEPGDLYALFSNLLDQAIDAAAQQQNDRRMIDLLVCRRQGFAVINVIGPALSGSQSDHGRRHSYELKVARRVVQKYSGTMATEPRGELFAVKIVMPLTRG